MILADVTPLWIQICLAILIGAVGLFLSVLAVSGVVYILAEAKTEKVRREEHVIDIEVRRARADRDIRQIQAKELDSGIHIVEATVVRDKAHDTHYHSATDPFGEK